MTAESVIVGFLFAYASLFNLRVVQLKTATPAQPVFSTVLAGLVVYGLILTAFRSLLLLFESIRTADPYERNYNAGYDVFLMVILGSGLYVLMNAVSVLHYARTGCMVTPPNETVLTNIGILFFGVWIVVLVSPLPLVISPRARRARSWLTKHQWLRWVVPVVLVVVDGALLLWILSTEEISPAGNCQLTSFLLKSPWCLSLLTILAVLTIITFWILMIPESSPSDLWRERNKKK
jgi:hypothetical protein